MQARKHPLENFHISTEKLSVILKAKQLLRGFSFVLTIGAPLNVCRV